MRTFIEGRAGGAVLAFALSLLGLPAAGQDPLPVPIAIGEPQAAVELTGIVQMEGVAVPGVSVSARRVEGGEVRATTTDALGRFRLSNLPPGTYELTARLQGFATITRQVTLSPGRASNVTLAFGGPVVVAEPRGPTPTPSALATTTPTPFPAASPTASPTPGRSLAVVERSETSDLALQSWLSEEATAGRRLEQVVPLRGGTSFFVFRTGDRAAKPPIVLLVAKVPTAASLETRLKANAPRRLLGLHFLPDGSCLLVLSDGD